MAQSNDKIYDLINAVRLELKQDISTMGTGLAAQVGKLDQKLDNLEAGRVANAEKDINTLKVKAATANVKLAVVGFIASSVIGAIVSTVIAKLAA